MNINEAKRIAEAIDELIETYILNIDATDLRTVELLKGLAKGKLALTLTKIGE